MQLYTRKLSMKHTLNLKVFFFNAETDYLPYYKNFSFTLNSDDKAETLLAHIQTANENFAYPRKNLIFKINDLMVDGEESIEKIVAKLGTELQIDPALSYRSNHCLIINDADFKEIFSLLSEYASKEDEAYYDSLYALHYASETFKFSHDYIGDAILLLAHRMIENGSEHKEAILTAISDPYDGLAACEYENNLFNAEFHTKEIQALNAMVIHTTTNTFMDKITAKFSKNALYAFEKESIEGSNIACYAGDSGLLDEISQKICDNGANIIHFPREIKLAGVSLLNKQDNLAYLKSATTLLNALDSGAELLVVAKAADLEMFRTHFASIQKRIGREIPLPMISVKNFNTLCETKETV